MSHSISINDKLYSEIKEYCDLNKIKVSSFCEEMLKKDLNEAKYGDIPFGRIGSEQINERKNEQINEPNESSSSNNAVEPVEKEPQYLSPLAAEYKKEMPIIDKEEAQKIIDMAINGTDHEKNKKPRKTRVLN